ncbi:TetR/AcrR family transcriptional regulator [Sedimentibacter hydroxybenzoicus DSM 7310]|uniref:TetR/AcrR family transcriptional regulator n=1 Tax=Sedimentibacter hydroxybenzoicus DSM 7310 TaxID=1123245 RepID=A0A974BMY7_SEDHY|nr:TetR/AcrR family transcriptional regulator [Sedimentibacter hydroxybenzoicus]NYB75692.1 TetR/AcrR family transcriptional regulator [Sedimentibacter hydroxybenzoicus DSM 7310]
MNKKIIQGNETKKRIVDCARKLFVEKGYNNVTVDEIINEANSSKGGFYTHFKTKEDLIYNMVPMVDEVYTDFFKPDRNYQNTMEEIAAFIGYVFSVMEKEIGLEFMSVIYSSQIKDLSTVRFLTSPEREYYNRLKFLVDKAKKKEEIYSDLSAEEIVMILTTCIRGVIYDWCLRKGSFQLADYGMKLISMILNQLKTQTAN